MTRITIALLVYVFVKKGPLEEKAASKITPEPNVTPGQDVVDITSALEVVETALPEPEKQPVSDLVEVFHQTRDANRRDWHAGRLLREFNNRSVEVDIGNGPMRKKRRYVRPATAA